MYYNQKKNPLGAWEIQKISLSILVATVGPVREELLLHDLCLLGAMTVDITQTPTRDVVGSPNIMHI